MYNGQCAMYNWVAEIVLFYKSGGFGICVRKHPFLVFKGP